MIADTLLALALVIFAAGMAYYGLKVARLLSNWMIDQIDRM